MMRIGIIGCGNMGEAVLKGIVLARIVPRRNIFISDIDSTKLNRIKGSYKVGATFNNSIVAKSSDVIIIALKPHDIPPVLAGISSDCFNNRKLVISVAAGITRKRIRSLLGENAEIARVMPNMPALIGEGISAVSMDGVSFKYKKITRKIFSTIGEIVEVNEKNFDAITAISGSGPAYFFYLVEVLIKSGVALGLKREVAEKLAVKTAQGSTQLLSRLRVDPCTLRKKVTSKGGTTEAAFNLFQKKKLGKILEEGIRKARDRSYELMGD